MSRDIFLLGLGADTLLSRHSQPNLPERTDLDSSVVFLSADVLGYGALCAQCKFGFSLPAVFIRLVGDEACQFRNHQSQNGDPLYDWRP